MNKYLLMSLSLAGCVLSGCASQQPALFKPFQVEDLNAAVTSGLYQQKTQHFLVINDSSSSMDDVYANGGFAEGSEPTKFNVEKELLNRMNKTIPNIKLTSGLRSFGFGACVNNGFTKLNQAMTDYSSAAFGTAITTLDCNSGGSPMATALEAANDDLATSNNNIALIIFSDGHELDSSPVPAVQALKAKYGNKLCVYPVWVGNENESQGRIVLNQLSDIGACGFSTTVAEIASSSGMSNFVKNVFFETKAAPPAPAPAPVATCKDKDDDGDGINNCDDHCDNTPKGAKVNRRGCWILNVKFDTNKYNIKPQYFSMLDNAAEVLKNNPGLNVEIQGHTDSDGSTEKNVILSNRRAESVKTYLVPKVGSAVNLTAKGYGESTPVCLANDTPVCKQENRRVQLDIK